MFMPKAAEIPRARVLLIDGEGQVWSHGGGGGGGDYFAESETLYSRGSYSMIL
jgi:hypothetical protein